MGINCELCMDGYYRPGEVAHYRVDACHACLCDGPGTSGLCVKDSTMQHLNIASITNSHILSNVHV